MKRSIRVVPSVRRISRHLGNAPKMEKTKRDDGNFRGRLTTTFAGSMGRINGTGSMKQHAHVLILCIRENVKHLLPPTIASQNVSLSSLCQHCHRISFLVWWTWYVSKYLRWVYSTHIQPRIPSRKCCVSFNLDAVRSPQFTYYNIYTRKSKISFFDVNILLRFPYVKYDCCIWNVWSLSKYLSMHCFDSENFRIRSKMEQQMKYRKINKSIK